VHEPYPGRRWSDRIDVQRATRPSSLSMTLVIPSMTSNASVRLSGRFVALTRDQTASPSIATDGTRITFRPGRGTCSRLLALLITFAANLALGLASGASLDGSAQIANAAGGVVVGKIGTGIATLSELESEFALGEEPEVS
jgi:hypothetical protein